MPEDAATRLWTARGWLENRGGTSPLRLSCKALRYAYGDWREGPFHAEALSPSQGLKLWLTARLAEDRSKAYSIQRTAYGIRHTAYGIRIAYSVAYGIHTSSVRHI
jgi:hypothetical protein